LQDYGIYELVVNVHHFANQMKDAIQKNKGWGSNVTISDESEEVLETGGGLLRAKAHFENEAKWLVMNADILTDLDLGKMLEADKAFDASSEGEMVATLAVTNRTTSRNLIFNTAGIIMWMEEQYNQ